MERATETVLSLVASATGSAMASSSRAPTNGKAAVETEAPRKRRRLTDCGSSMRLVGMDVSTA
jgi:hypothetical protein